MLDATLARRIRLVGFDVDGVMTDGGIYVGLIADHPTEFKRLKMLREAGIVVVLVSARSSEATEVRAREIKVDEVVHDNKKLPAFESLLARRGIEWNECAFVGDDLPDLPLLRRVALPIAVASAVAEVKAAADLVTAAAGGAAAMREVAETLLKARGVWDDLVKRYLEQRGDVEARSSRAG